MGLKESLKALQALNALPRKDAEEVVEAWMDQVETKPAVAAKTASVSARKEKPGVRQGMAYTKQELEKVNQLIQQGYNPSDIARKLRREFGKARTFGAWEKLAQRMSRGYEPTVSKEPTNAN